MVRRLAGAFVALAMTAVAFAQGVPEPGIVLYGKVWSPTGLLVAGSLLWRYTPPTGTRVELTVSLRDIVTPAGEHFSYRASIPAESVVPGYPGSGNALPVTETTVQYTRSAFVDGAQATIAGERTTDTFSAAERGKVERVDLAVGGAPIPVGGIAGTVTYAGRQTGAVLVQVSLDPAFAGLPERQVQATAARSGVWQYAVADLPAGAYYVRAFMDTESDGNPGDSEAQGVYARNPAQLPPEATDVDLLLVDADRDHDSLPDWWEALRPGGLAPGFGDDDDGDGAWNGLEYALGTDPDEKDSAPGPLAWWRLDEAAGSAAADASGNLHGGALDNGPAWAQGIHAGALRFDGQDDQVTVPPSPDLGLTDSLTLQAWIWREGPWTHDGRVICRHDGVLETGYGLGVSAADSTIELLLNDGYRVASTGTVPFARWVHVAATFAAGAGTVKLYLDGRLDSVHPRTETCPTNALDLRLGAAAGGGKHFAGLIDEPKVFSYARSADAIAGDAFAVTSFAINQGAAATPSRTVTLDVTYGGNPTDYLASERPDFADAAWRPFAAAAAFTLSAGDGAKTVYLRVRSAEAEWGPVSDAIVLDATAPVVIEVDSATPDGIYGVGSLIDITVTFSEPVTVTGTPQFRLETGADDGVAPYLATKAAPAVAFRYTVAAGQDSADLDCAGSGALDRNGGSIRDAAGNDAVLTLPAPGAPHSLGANRAIAVGNVHTVAYGAEADGQVEGTLRQLVVHGSSTVAVTAVAATCHEFVRWSDGVTANPRQDTSVATDIAVVAQFQAITYTATFLAGPGGSLTGNRLQTVDCGEACTPVTAVPDPGYEFDRWSDGGGENPRTLTNVQADLTLTALFFTAAPPDGEFDLRFDSPANPAGRRVYDLTGPYHGAMGAYALTLDLGHDEKGILTGTGTVAGPMPSGTVVDIPGTLRGEAKGSAGAVSATISLGGSSPSSSARATLLLALTAGDLAGRFTCRIVDTAGGRNLAAGPCAYALPADMDGSFGLTVDLDPSARGSIRGTGLMTLSNGRTVALLARGRTKAGVTALQLAGDTRADPLFGAVTLKLTIRTFSNGTGRILDLSGTAFGQNINWP
jgi:hypothetical protein